MKKNILLVLLALMFSSSYAQKKGGFRVGLDLGYVPAREGGGGLFSLEPKFNVAHNMNIGLRCGLAAVVRDLVTDTNNADYTAKVAAITSFVGTYDYYFHKSGSGNSFAPYLGAGFGHYSLANVEIDDSSAISNDYVPTVSGVFGGLVRAGFEWSGFRMGVEYNFIPDSDLEDVTGVKKGTSKNTYFGVNIGFFVGGGKWRK